jgi:hypothetical protein
VTASVELGERDLAEFESDITDLGNDIIARDYSDIVPVRMPICAECEFLKRCTRFWEAQDRSDIACDGPFFEGHEAPGNVAGDTGRR